MSIGSPSGILDIRNATLKVSRLEVTNATGFDTTLNNIARNTILLVDATEQTSSNSWALKLPNAWVGEFEGYWSSGASGNIDFNFYNNITSGTNGYTLSMDDTTIVVKYDGTTLQTTTLSSTLKTSAYRKVHILFERDTISVSIDGKNELNFKDSSLRARVYDDEAGGYITVAGLDSTNRKFKNLKVVNEKWISDGTSNIAYMGGNVGLGTSTPVASLHINSTDSIILPSGTTAQRNQTPTIGMLRYNSETGYLEAYTVSGWGSIATPPTLTSFSPSVVTPAASNGTDLTINGAFFDENTTVQLRDTSGTLYSTTNLVFTNSGLITVTLGSLAADSYTLVVTNGAGLSVDSASTFVVNTPPVWSSPAAGATLEFLTITSSTTTLSATDPDGGTITYSLVSGTLPAGLTLSGSTISGTSGASGGTLTPITIRASDGIGFTDRSFTIATQEVGEAVFTTATTHTWTVPAGVYSVTAVAVGGGGGGANYFGSGGAGGGLAYRNNISVTPGQQYSVVVGVGGPGLISGSDLAVAAGSQPANNGGTSSFGSFFSATGGQHGSGNSITGSLPSGGVPSGSYTGGGNGGSTYGNYSGAQGDGSYVSSGGGGAGGYSGTGGIGGGSNSNSGSATYVNATAGTGGGGGGGAGMATGTSTTNYGGGGGGGVGLFGQGSNGVAGTIDLTQASPDGNMVGGGGSGGGNGGVPPSPQLGGPGGLYGGGGGSCNGTATASNGGNGGQGAVRIIWGNNRSFPSTNVGQSQSYGNVSTY